MPRVSAAHLDARREQILDAARTCFLRSGFHATSMNDVLREAGLSVGAVYRYFRGKDEIVQAIAEDALAAVAAPIMDGPGIDPPTTADLLRRMLQTLVELDERRGVLRIAVQAWSEAQRSPVLADRVTQVHRRLHDVFRALVVAAHGPVVDAADPRPSTDPDPDAVADVLVGLLLGFAAQRALGRGIDPVTYVEGLRGLPTGSIGPRRTLAAPQD